MQSARFLGPRNVTDVGLALFISTLLFVEALRMFLAGVYAMNALTVGLNASALAALFLLSPLAYLFGLARLPAGILGPAFGFGFLLARLTLFVPWSVDVLVMFSGIAVALYLLFLVPFLDGALRFAGGPATAASSVALALAADLALRILGNSVDPGASPWSVFYLLPLGIVFLYLLLHIPFPADPGRSAESRSMPRRVGIGLGGFLGLSTIVLLYPSFLDRWNPGAVTGSAPSLLLGFCLGAYLARAGFGSPARAHRWSAALQVLLGIFAVDLAFLGSDLVPVLAFVAAVALAVGLERILAWAAAFPPTLRTLGSALSLALILYTILLFAFTFTLTYAYVPAPAVWKDHAPVVLLLLAASFVFPALAAGPHSPSAVSSASSRRWTASIAAAVLLLASLGFALNLPVAPQAADVGVVRVMTYNVHQGFSVDGRLDVARIAEVIHAVNPDVLALQESDTVRMTTGGVDLVGYLSSVLGYHAAYGPPARAQTYGVSILSRFRITSWDYALLTSTEDQRAVVHAVLAVGAASMHVFSTHLGLDGPEREVQAAEVLRITGAYSGPKVLMGDFNACPSGLCPEPDATSDRVYRDVTATWYDAWRSTAHDVEDPAGYTYDSVEPYERIDYVFVSAIVGVLQCEVFRGNAPLDASDHLPVVAQLSTTFLP